jgi:hypothetical protein
MRGFRQRDADGCDRDRRYNIGVARFARCRTPPEQFYESVASVIDLPPRPAAKTILL